MGGRKDLREAEKFHFRSGFCFECGGVCFPVLAPQYSANSSEEVLPLKGDHFIIPFIHSPLSMTDQLNRVPFWKLPS